MSPEDPAELIAVLAVMAFMVAVVVIGIVVSVRYGRRRLAQTGSAATQYGFTPVQGPLFWLRTMPAYPRGRLIQAYAGQRGGRTVVLGEYFYSDPTPFVRSRHVLSVAAVQLRRQHPPQEGHGRLGFWRVVGPDIITVREGVLDFNQMLPLADDLLGAAAWLEGEGY